MNGSCHVGLTVDEQAVPKDVHIVKNFRANYDLNAIEAVRKYQFKPALSDGRQSPKYSRLRLDTRITEKCESYVINSVGLLQR
ncbi:energy transducer TonB [Edaphobacter modestus]|uniref:energy transducer TonB n=1 Tax=Edaphobacter modestus TaxID=388466 RepID=UPI003BF90F6B